jgi:phosphomannomutase/phosphoglucomutase
MAQSSVASVRQPAPALPPPEIFKAYDIRGIVGSSLTPQHAQLIGCAIGSEAIERGLKSLAFARDGRLSGPELGMAFVKGVQSTGVDVIDVGMVPTPVLYFAAIEKANGSGVMLTGSHNPPDYNGFKMMLGGETLSGDQIQKLRERIESSQFASGAGNYSSQGVGKAYLDRIVGDVKLKKPLSVVIDCGNGVAGAIAPLLFKSMGCRVTELYCDVDGKFPNHHPDPSKPENMQDLITMVKSKNADIGLAFDGDGDRLGVIDAAGNIIYPDRLMMLFAMDVLKRNQGAQIIYDIKCSNNLTKVIWERGGEPVMWKTGHSLIKAKMKQSGALLAGEMSGHIFFSERWYGFDDGLYSGARLLEILSARRESSTEVFAALPDAVNTPEINVKMREGEHHRFIETLMMQADFGDANVTMIDGIRADYPDGWGLVRASNTTPVLVLRFEGKDQKAMQRIQQAFKVQMLAVKPDLKLPF